MKNLLLNAFISLAITCSSLSGKAWLDNKSNTEIDNEKNTVEETNCSLTKQQKNMAVGNKVLKAAAALTTYHDYDENIDDRVDDYLATANKIGEEGIIKGSIELNDEDKRYEFNLGEIDKDYFRFSICEETKYSFSLNTAPGPNYYYSIFAFNSNGDDRRSENHLEAYEQDLIYSSKSSNRTREMVLRAGTYYILITSSTKNGIRPEKEYMFTFTKSYATDYLEEITFSNYYMSEYPIVIWESENIPNGVNRWSDEIQTLCKYSSRLGDGEIFIKDGFVDPIDLEYPDVQVPLMHVVPRKRYNLDSITYVCDESAIREMKNDFERIRDETSEKLKDKKIKEIKAKIVSDGLNLISFELSILALPASGGVAVAISVTSFFVSSLSMALLMEDILEYEARDNDLDHVLTVFDYGCNLTFLIERCDDILNGTEPNKILKLPRYSYIFNENVILPDATQNETNAVKIAFTYFIAGLYKGDYFYQTKGSTITRYQTMPGTNKTFKGKLKVFTDMDSYNYYKESPTENKNKGGFQPIMQYDISGSGSNYTLSIYNPGSVGIFAMYNSSAVSDTQGAKFLFKANDYSSVLVERYSRKTVSLGSRKYVYIRENKDPYVTKVYVNSKGVTCCRSISYQEEYLKLSVVKKSGNKWTIRVRNFSMYNQLVYFNSTMCFLDDAKNWTTKLTNWKNNKVTVFFNDYKDVVISENWFADYIAISYVDEVANTRYVSYAKDLNSSNKTLTCYTNAIGI